MSDEETDILPQPDQATEVVTLEQWATEESKRDPRVELLNAFVTVERGAGRFTNTRLGWANAYSAFATRPVR